MIKGVKGRIFLDLNKGIVGVVTKTVPTNEDGFVELYIHPASNNFFSSVWFAMFPKRYPEPIKEDNFKHIVNKNYGNEDGAVQFVDILIGDKDDKAEILTEALGSTEDNAKQVAELKKENMSLVAMIGNLKRQLKDSDASTAKGFAKQKELAGTARTKPNPLLGSGVQNQVKQEYNYQG